jgi:hypothetical protein
MQTQAILQVDQEQLASLRVVRVRAGPGLGIQRLFFDLEFQFLAPLEEPRISLVHLAGELYAGPVDDSASPRYLGGLALGSLGFLVPPDRRPANILKEMATETDPQRLEALEELRRGGGVNFMLDLDPVVIIETRPLQLPRTQLRMAVSQSDWLVVLSQLGHSRKMLFEVPIPGSGSQRELHAARNFLAQAELAFQRGEYRDSVARCRDVLETLSKVYGDRAEVDAEDFSNLRAKDKEARFRLVRRALQKLADLAHHADESPTPTEWNRADASAVLAMVAAVFIALQES